MKTQAINEAGFYLQATGSDFLNYKKRGGEGHEDILAIDKYFKDMTSPSNG